MLCQAFLQQKIISITPVLSKARYFAQDSNSTTVCNITYHIDHRFPKEPATAPSSELLTVQPFSHHGWKKKNKTKKNSSRETKNRSRERNHCWTQLWSMELFRPVKIFQGNVIFIITLTVHFCPEVKNRKHKTP